MAYKILNVFLYFIQPPKHYLKNLKMERFKWTVDFNAGKCSNNIHIIII